LSLSTERHRVQVELRRLQPQDPKRDQPGGEAPLDLTSAKYPSLRFGKRPPLSKSLAQKAALHAQPLANRVALQINERHEDRANHDG
jgi:hypothetical protein